MRRGGALPNSDGWVAGVPCRASPLDGRHHRHAGASATAAPLFALCPAPADLTSRAQVGRPSPQPPRPVEAGGGPTGTSRQSHLHRQGDHDTRDVGADSQFRYCWAEGGACLPPALPHARRPPSEPTLNREGWANSLITQRQRWIMDLMGRRQRIWVAGALEARCGASIVGCGRYGPETEAAGCPRR